MKWAEEVRQVARILEESTFAIALSGAGISVDSGIPDFRSPGGLWTKFDPMQYATISAFNRDPARVWTMLFEMDELIRTAEPNPGHLALAELEKLGRLQAIVTQNIDGLHQRAGSQRVIEFHGGTDRLVCLQCGKQSLAKDYERGQHPRCLDCGKILKPDVVFFGEAIPSAALNEAFDLASQCDVVLVVGTSAIVSPASEVPVLAKQSGAQLCEFNLEPTGLSPLADVCVHGSAGETLPALVELLRG